ncbi:MAG: hypothetical protein SFU99_11695 [Saprospiraceae bacterium]|nr:hypothetical protein [Saprospiraceae bacterium]
MNRTAYFFHRVDLIGQFLLLLAAGFSGISALVVNKDFAIFYFMSLFLIGCWQLLSAFIRGVSYEDQIKLHYFFIASFYCVLLFTIFLPLLDTFRRWEFPLIIWFVGFVPAVAAIWYLSDCIRGRAEDMADADQLGFIPSRLPLYNPMKPLKKIHKKQALFRYL